MAMVYLSMLLTFLVHLLVHGVRPLVSGTSLSHAIQFSIKGTVAASLISPASWVRTALLAVPGSWLLGLGAVGAVSACAAGFVVGFLFLSIFNSRFDDWTRN